MMLAARPAVNRRWLAWLTAGAVASAAVGFWQALPITMLLTPVMAILVLVLRRPWIAILLFILSVPVQEFGAAGPLTATRASAGLAVGAYAIALLTQRRPLVWHRFELPFLALLAVMLASTAVARRPTAALAETARWGVALVALFVFVQFFGRAAPRRLIWMLAVIAAGGALEALLGLAQSALAVGPASFQIGAVTRSFGTFGRPNSFAGYLELTLFPTLWIGVHYLTRLPTAFGRYRRARLRGMIESRVERRTLALTATLAAAFTGAAALILAGIATSFSRGAWLGVAAGAALTVVLYANWTRVAVLIATPALGVLLLGGASQFVPAELSGRLASIANEVRPFDASTIVITNENFAAVERMAHWQAGWRMFEDNPLLGVGAGNFNVRYPDYFVRPQFRISRGHAHNIYIQMLAELGVLGLVAYLTLVGSFILLALRVAIGAPQGFARMLALGSLGTLVSVSTHNIFDDLQVLNLGVQLSAVWCLTIAAHRLWRSGEATRDLPGVEYSAA